MGDNAYKVELLGDMNISAIFNVGDLAAYIKDENEDIGDLRANSLQGGEVDAEQTMRSNLPNNIKAWIQFGPLITYEDGSQVFGSLRSLLVLEP